MHLQYISVQASVFQVFSSHLWPVATSSRTCNCGSRNGDSQKRARGFSFFSSILPYLFSKVLRWPFPARIILCQPFPERECFLEKIRLVEKHGGQAASHAEGTLCPCTPLGSPRIPCVGRRQLVARTVGLRNPQG